MGFAHWPDAAASPTLAVYTSLQAHSERSERLPCVEGINNLGKEAEVRFFHI